ncbi:MAG: M28 family peptidase [Bacteroidales bacterium]|nr:M28 family peptidase [Bacteroidales bacterium]
MSGIFLKTAHEVYFIYRGYRMLCRTVGLIIVLNICSANYGQDIQYAWQIIDTLCSEQFKGRGFVKNGDKKTAALIRTIFRENGLEPLTENYYQPFQIAVNTFPKSIELVLGNRPLVPGRDFVISPSSPSFKGTFKLYAIRAEDLIHQVAPDSLQVPDGSESCILIDNRHNDELDANARDLLSGIITRLQNSLATNIAGIVELTSEKLSWGISTDISLRPYIKVNYPADPDTLENIFIDLKNRFRKKYTTKNVAGYIRGTECPDSFIVFTAHYDHLGQMGADTYFPGANDNASGVAMLLYLSRYFQQNPPRISIAFVSFSAEEIGLVGSFHFVNHAPFDLRKIKFLVNFDLVGTGSEGIKAVNGTIYPDEFQLLKEINDEFNFLPEVSERSATCISDHCPFDYKGVPGFYIYTTGDSPDYHSIFDRPEALSMAGFEGLATLIIQFVNYF